jgi:hypothetical protein
MGHFEVEKEGEREAILSRAGRQKGNILSDDLEIDNDFRGMKVLNET